MPNFRSNDQSVKGQLIVKVVFRQSTRLLDLQIKKMQVKDCMEMKIPREILVHDWNVIDILIPFLKQKTVLNLNFGGK